MTVVESSVCSSRRVPIPRGRDHADRPVRSAAPFRRPSSALRSKSREEILRCNSSRSDRLQVDRHARNLASKHAQPTDDAEQIMLSRIDALEREGGDDYELTALLNRLGLIYMKKQRSEDAEEVLKRALIIREENNMPDIEECLGYLAETYMALKRYGEAEMLQKRRVAILERRYGVAHPAYAAALHALAKVYHYNGRYQDAVPLYQKALSVREQVLGTNHHEVALTLNNLAQVYRKQGRYEEAALLYKRCMAIRMKRPTSAPPAVQS